MHRARECLNEILELYQTGPNEKRPELLDRVADLFFLTLDQQSTADTDAFGDVMERMAYDADAISRAHLSERIAKNHTAPLALLRRLARDDICIARPVLQYSPCLREGDLVSISSEAEQDHLMATAHRSQLSKPVTDIIVARGELDVLKIVIGNIGAEISAESRAKLSKIPGLQEDLQRAMSARRDMTPSPMDRLKKLTEVEFWQQITEAALMTDDEPDQAQPATQAPEEDVILNERDSRALKNKSDKEIEIKPAPPAAEKLLVDAARSGKIEDTVKIFSKITHLDEAMIEHCLLEAHLPALMVLCKAHSMAAATFTAMLQFRESHARKPVKDTVGLLRRYDGMTPKTAQRIIRFSDKRRELDGELQEPELT